MKLERRKKEEKMTKKRLIAFPYYGGKNYHVNWLVPLLPYDDVYVEPFGGSMAVLLNREPSTIEVYNDLDEAIVNLFRVLRENGDALIRQLVLTPYARKERENSTDVSEDPIEWARRTFVLARQSILKMRGGSWGRSLLSRYKTSKHISSWLNGIDGLLPVIERIRKVMIECRPALQVISRYDSSETVFYLDPPFPKLTRRSFDDYDYEMSQDEHKELLDLILSLEGKVAISSYHNDLYDTKLSKWWVHEEEEKQLAGGRGLRQEVLWMNYDPKEVVAKEQTQLFDYFE